MPVVFDTTFLLPIFFPEARFPREVEDASERFRHLTDELSKRQEVIIVPTPALSELLVSAKDQAPKILASIERDKNFRIAPFGVREAVEVARWTAQSIEAGDKRQGVDQPWQKVKFDRQICAIGKTERASVIYSDDGGVQKHAGLIGLKSIGISEVPLPPKPPQRGFSEVDPEWGRW